MRFKFEATYKGNNVASGEASAVLAYTFQKAFIDSIGPGAEAQGGFYLTLNHIHARKIGESDTWITKSVEGALFTFFLERIA